MYVKGYTACANSDYVLVPELFRFHILLISWPKYEFSDTHMLYVHESVSYANIDFQYCWTAVCCNTFVCGSGDIVFLFCFMANLYCFGEYDVEVFMRIISRLLRWYDTFICGSMMTLYVTIFSIGHSTLGDAGGCAIHLLETTVPEVKAKNRQHVHMYDTRSARSARHILPVLLSRC